MQKNLTTLSKSSADANFGKRLDVYKAIINDEIATKVELITRQTAEVYGEQPLEAVAAYCDVLSRGGKRIRGALAMVALTRCLVAQTRK